MTLEPKEVVRRGYDAVSHRYRSDTDDGGERVGWIKRLLTLLPAGAEVLDLGCGCGLPVSLLLAQAGARVTGVDLSEVQVARARQLVPAATFQQADASTVDFPAGTFDAVVCLYTIIHIPLDEQTRVLSAIASWLRPAGILLITTGSRAWTGTESDWLGGGAAMWWSHADAQTYRRWLAEASLLVEAEEFVPEGDSGHQLFWCRSVATAANAGGAQPGGVLNG